MDYDDAFNIGSIQLEPRLQEYLRRKRFNEENDIEPPISEEKEFCITPHDLKIIKRFKQGKKKVYTSSRLAKDPHFVKPSADAFEELNDEDAFKKDPRYQRLQRKLQSHRDAQKKIRDFEGLDEDYTIFHQSNPYDLKPEKKPQRISKPYDDPDSAFADDDGEFDGTFDDSIMMDSRDLVLAPSRPKKSMNASRAGSRETTRDFGYKPNRPDHMENFVGRDDRRDRRDRRENRVDHMGRRVSSREQVHQRSRAYSTDDTSYEDQYTDSYSSRRDGRNSGNSRNPDRGQYCYSPNDRSGRENTYHHPPRINYKQRLTREQVSGGREHSRELKDIIGNIDVYNKHLDKTYEYVDNEYDLDSRTVTPGARTATRRETPSSYQSVPFGYGNGLPDVSLEDSLRGGIRDSSKKSIGFKNPFENQFDYISSDISDSKHTVQMWPQSTRGQNREMARPNSASARHDQEMRDRRMDRPSQAQRRDSNRR
ncbi:hypothetical protein YASMINEVIRUS_740 [Yasminevirus sp. GU-2018]|uniref:Uncharacterized protein n=1 Tax=Yasminevirus sp. GU-2018 TaxID=2420051 RepID=A0A5K0U8Q7_9VIRU|nr:hypothetical protein YASMINEVIRUS_740 [Yasminevirus sp. GU-2018]